MNEDQTHTLAELAEICGLTERTTRYYIEKVLPPHHKQGRGKIARYGPGTLNSIRFITLVKERYGFKPGQVKSVLASVPQETIDRVVRGEEEVAVMPVPSGRMKLNVQQAGALPRSKLRAAKYIKNTPQMFSPTRPATEDTSSIEEDMLMSDAGPEINELFSYSSAEPEQPWRTIYADEHVRIQRRGNQELSQHQEEQIEAAARLIKLALK